MEFQIVKTNSSIIFNCSIRIEFEILQLTDLDCAKAKVATRNSNSFSPSYQ